MSAPNDITCEACGHQTVDLGDDPSSLYRSGRDPEVAPDRKAVLFCPSCGHEGAIEGDWIVHAGTNQYSLECPDCGYIVIKRPQSDVSPF